MGQQNYFHPGEKAPNHGIYMEIGETGSMVKDPQVVELAAGERFPENKNEDRKWMRRPKKSK
ncbi:YjzC family protein [Scopulibacillus cellulosilyticus]|uniref:YjzC family protein n=1 Tax=Scopulibacillus cellulosilyticus TaxID=2665665 RepID=A0ABW2PYG3_9BACL